MKKPTGEKKMLDGKIDDYGLGWVFFKSDGVRGGHFVPFEDDDMAEWMKGFCAAQADDDLEPYRHYPSIQAALLDLGIDADLLEACLRAAEIVHSSDEWCLWPSVPVRGFGSNVLRTGPIVYVLPDAANDEVG